MCGGAGGVARAQAELDTAMVMTFGAVAASKLPPKRRPRLDPRVLDSLLNGTPCDYASSCAPLAPHCTPCVWSQVSTCHRRRPRTTCSRRMSRRTGGLQLRRARCRSSSWSRVVLRQGARTSRWSSRRHSRGNAEFKWAFVADHIERRNASAFEQTGSSLSPCDISSSGTLSCTT